MYGSLNQNMDDKFFVQGIFVIFQKVNPSEIFPNNCHILILDGHGSHVNAPPHSLKDSNTNPKMKIMEKKKVRVHSLVRNISGVERRVRVVGWGL
jgi:hypothetical protein